MMGLLSIGKQVFQVAIEPLIVVWCPVSFKAGRQMSSRSTIRPERKPITTVTSLLCVCEISDIMSSFEQSYCSSIRGRPTLKWQVASSSIHFFFEPQLLIRIRWFGPLIFFPKVFKSFSVEWPQDSSNCIKVSFFSRFQTRMPCIANRGIQPIKSTWA